MGWQFTAIQQMIYSGAVAALSSGDVSDAYIPHVHNGGHIAAEAMIERKWRQLHRKTGAMMNAPEVCSSACLMHTDEVYFCVDGDESFGVHYITSRGGKKKAASQQRAYRNSVHPALRPYVLNADHRNTPGNPIMHRVPASVLLGAGVPQCVLKKALRL